MPISAEDVERLVAGLVAIDSVNPTLVPRGAGEAEVMSFAAAWLADAGLDIDVVEAAPGRPSVVATARGTGGGRSLMLNGHLDTVGVEGMSEPHTPRVRDGRLYGRGGYDMKGGVAACMLAAAAAVHVELAGDVVVCAVADEEHSSIGVQAVLEHLQHRCLHRGRADEPRRRGRAQGLRLVGGERCRPRGARLAAASGRRRDRRPRPGARRRRRARALARRPPSRAARTAAPCMLR